MWDDPAIGSAVFSVSVSIIWLTGERIVNNTIEGRTVGTYTLVRDLCYFRVSVVSLTDRRGASPGSFWFLQDFPLVQSGLTRIAGETRPFLLSLIHQSRIPHKKTSVAHHLQIFWRGAAGLGSIPPATPWISVKSSWSNSGVNCSGVFWMCWTIWASG